MSAFDDLIHHALDERRSAHLLRERRVLAHLDATHVEHDGQRLINFSSNNYLGLTHHPRMIAAQRSLPAAGAAAAGLISGHTVDHAQAEAAIAGWKQTEAALLLPSGYQANVAAIQAIAAVAAARGKTVRFLVDKLVHASLIDAIRSTQSPMRVFPHNGCDKLERLLADTGGETDGVQVVVTESVFSMDGDLADLPAIVALKQKYDFVLMVDEAHGSGVYGPHGAGLVAELGLRDLVDLSVVTLSKALGLAGGAICGSRALVQAVLNFGRAYIYTTAVAPAMPRLALEAIQILRDEPQRQQRVRALATEVRRTLAAARLRVSSAGDSPIIPILLSDEQAAIAEADRLRALGLLVMPVRPPTVPRGTSRLRVTLSSEHTDDDVKRLCDALIGR